MLYIILSAFFPILFIVGPLLLSHRLWKKLVKRYKALIIPDGENISLGRIGVSAFMFRSNGGKINDEGIYIRIRSIISSLYPPVFIPWKEFKTVSVSKSFKGESKEVVIGDPKIEKLIFERKVFEKIEKYLD